MQTFYTYDTITKRLTPAPKYATISATATTSSTRYQRSRDPRLRPALQGLPGPRGGMSLLFAPVLL